MSDGLPESRERAPTAATLGAGFGPSDLGSDQRVEDSGYQDASIGRYEARERGC